MGKLKVAVIGCGGIANQKHFPALKNNADLNEIVAFCDIKIERAQEAAEKMVEAWKKSGMQFTVGYQNRFRPEVQNLHAACQKGDLGDIYYAKAHAVRRRGVPTWGVFMDKEAQGGGGEEGTIDNRQWLEAVKNGTEPLVKPEEALAVTKILDAIYKSAKKNKEIKF